MCHLEFTAIPHELLQPFPASPLQSLGYKDSVARVDDEAILSVSPCTKSVCVSIVKQLNRSFQENRRNILSTLDPVQQLPYVHSCSHSCSAYSVLSGFTLALLEDSGWYQANYTVAERTVNGDAIPLLYGKGGWEWWAEPVMEYCIWVGHAWIGVGVEYIYKEVLYSTKFLHIVAQSLDN